jgi:hypothetical protein
MSIAPGVYLREDAARDMSAAARHRAAVDAVVPRLIGDPVVSHISAAVLHGLPFTHSELPPVHVIKRGSGKSRRSSGLQAHRASCAAEDVVSVGGLPVTSVARTVLDCARILPFDHAVVLADAALHRALVTKVELAGQLARQARVPGVRGAAAVLSFADGRSESAGESHSRVVLHRAGLPAPRLQVPVFDVDEMPLGTADFGYPLARVIGEFDGHTPFGRLRSGEFPFDVPAQEKTAEQEREHRLRLAGWRVIRWTWADLAAPNELLARLSAALSARC